MPEGGALMPALVSPNLPRHCEGCPRGTVPATQRVTVSFTDERPTRTFAFCDGCSRRISDGGKYLKSIVRVALR